MQRGTEMRIYVWFHLAAGVGGHFTGLIVGEIAQTDQTGARFGINMQINSEISWRYRVGGLGLRGKAYSRDRHPFWQIE
jgi:hypothetical protein